jgi:hypothetical protein
MVFSPPHDPVHLCAVSGHAVPPRQARPHAPPLSSVHRYAKLHPRLRHSYEIRLKNLVTAPVNESERQITRERKRKRSRSSERARKREEESESERANESDSAKV